MNNLNPMLAELKEEYISELSHKMDLLKQLKANNSFSELRDNYHKLKGSGKLYGLPEVSELAEIMEYLYSKERPGLTELQILALEVLEKIQIAHQNHEDYPLEQDSAFLKLKSLAS